MARICVVYHSVTGSTAQLAHEICAGADSVTGCEACELPIRANHFSGGRFEHAETLEHLDDADAIVFGAPTFMGGPSGQFKCFADATSERWESKRWEGKLAAGFSVGASPSGDQLATIQYFALLTAQHGMLWVGLDLLGAYDPDGRNRLGAQLGLIVQSREKDVLEADRVTARYFGARVARKALVLAGEDPMDA
jgi:NAD(P)H dehydrogenase (quinone)